MNSFCDTVFVIVMQINLFVVVALKEGGVSEFCKSEIEELQMKHTYKTISDLSSKQKLEFELAMSTPSPNNNNNTLFHPIMYKK